MGSTFIATSSAALLECVPFILASGALACVPRLRAARLVPYLGCGCGAGPSARSIPGALAAAAVFGPAVALARLLAGIVAARWFRSDACGGEVCVLPSLLALLPVCLCAGAFSLVLPVLALRGIAAVASGAILGFAAAPCALGVPALAGVLHASSPAAAAAFLCVAGICDARTFRNSHLHAHATPKQHDAFAYLLLAVACAVTALRGGADLVHPLIAYALACCAVALGITAVKHRAERAPSLRVAPALMLAGLFVHAPLPAYHATETTLAQSFAGEPVDFTGIATQTGSITTIVRYAIVCCRADAAPIVVRLAQRAPALHGWVHARGVFVNAPDGLALRVQLVRSIAAPPDPFVYR